MLRGGIVGLAGAAGVAAFPAAQRGAFVVVPPQSTSLSSPFWIPSSGRGVAQTPSSQEPLEQFAGSLHAVPSAHFGLRAPPQSKAGVVGSVSVAFGSFILQAAAMSTIAVPDK